MAKLNLSQRVLGFPENPIRGLESLVPPLTKAGIEVIRLNIGAPDTPTPLKVRQAGSNFLIKTKTIRYGPSAGNEDLRQVLVQFYQDRLGICGLNADQLIITQGASEALDLIFYAVADPGEEILVPDPGYPNYLAIAYKHGLKIKPIATDLRDGFHLIKQGETQAQAVKRISRLVTKKTRALLWSSPGNPTGAVFGPKELLVLYQVARKHNLFLIADEVYRFLIFTTGIQRQGLRRAVSIYDVISQKERQRVFVLDSTSKMLGFCGGRIGMIWGDQNRLTHIASNASVRGCASTVGQAAAAALTRVDNKFFADNLEEFKQRRDLLHQGLKQLAFLGLKVSPQPPEGAFYLVADLGEGIIAADFCRWLLTEYPRLAKTKTTVFLTPMRMGKGGFYFRPKIGMGQVRIAYVLQKSQLQQALTVLRRSMPLYRQQKGLA